MATQMTRAQFEAKFGATPQVANAPVRMTRAEFTSRFGVAPPSKKEESGGLAGFARSVFKPAVTLAARPIQAGIALAGGTEEQQKISLPFFGDIETVRSRKDVIRDVGRAAETIAFGIGGGAVAQVGRRALGATIRGGIGAGALVGAGADVAETGEIGISTLKQGAIGAAFGGATAGVLGKALPAIGRGVGAGVSIARRAVPVVRRVTPKVGKTIAETTFGTKGVRAIRTGFNQPKIQQKVLSGEINTNTISQKVGALAQKSRDKSIKALQASRQKITGSVTGQSVTKKINQTMSRAIKDRPFLREEQQIVNKLTQFLRQEIKTTGRVSKKKLDSLIQRIDDAGFFKSGTAADRFGNSNKVVTAVRKELREITRAGNPKFASLLDKASKKDIPFFEKLGKNIVGRDGNINVDLLQTKINQLVNAIDDPNKKQESLRLLRELARRVGAKGDFLNELEVFARTRILMRDRPGFQKPLRALQEISTRGFARGAREASQFIEKRGSVFGRGR